MRLYRMAYNIGTVTYTEWFSSKGDASARRDALRKETGKRMDFGMNTFNIPISRTNLPKFLTNPELFIEPETPLTLD